MRFPQLMLLGLSASMLISNLVYAEEHYLITNKTGVTIDELYVSATSTNHWGSDILGKETLDNGETAEILFHPDDDRCNWDISIKDTHQNELEWTNIDLCKYTKITLKPKGIAEFE